MRTLRAWMGWDSRGDNVLYGGIMSTWSPRARVGGDSMSNSKIVCSAERDVTRRPGCESTVGMTPPTEP